MRRDRTRIQIGDVLYQASKSYRKVFRWEVKEIWLEDYVSGSKTIVRCHNDTFGTNNLFASDIVSFYNTEEEAWEDLKSQGIVLPTKSRSVRDLTLKEIEAMMDCCNYAADLPPCRSCILRTGTSCDLHSMINCIRLHLKDQGLVNDLGEFINENQKSDTLSE